MIPLFRFAFMVVALVTFVMAALPHPPPVPGNPPDKILHMTAFAILSGLAVAAWPTRTVLQIWLGLVAFGALIEAVQAIPALNRNSEFLDLVADSVAALAAGWIVRRAVAGRRRRVPDRD